MKRDYTLCAVAHVSRTLGTVRVSSRSEALEEAAERIDSSDLPRSLCNHCSAEFDELSDWEPLVVPEGEPSAPRLTIDPPNLGPDANGRARLRLDGRIVGEVHIAEIEAVREAIGGGP